MDVIWLRPMNGVRSTRPLSRLQMDLKAALLPPIYPVNKSQSGQRREATDTILQNMKEHSSHLFQQAILVSEKLIRVAILCHEQWHEGLEDALRSGRRAHVYFGIVLHPPSLPFSILLSLSFPLPPPLPPHQDVFW